MERIDVCGENHQSKVKGVKSQDIFFFLTYSRIPTIGNKSFFGTRWWSCHSAIVIFGHLLASSRMVSHDDTGGRNGSSQVVNS